MKRPGRETLLWAASGVLAFSLLLLLGATLPLWEAHPSYCFFPRFLGFEGPGCGMLRALAHLGRGEWRAAFDCHPLALPLVMEGAVLWSLAGLRLQRGRPWPALSRLNLWLGVHLLGFLLVWVWRLASGTLV